jgi:AraC-like DNA-binding protein
MDLQTLECIAATNYYLKKADSAIFQGESLIKRISRGKEKTDLLLGRTASLITLKGDCNFRIEKNTLAFGVVKDHESDLSLVFGPFNICGEMSEEEIRQYMIEGKIPLNKADNLKTFFHSLPALSFSNFTELLLNLNASINHNLGPIPAPAQDIYPSEEIKGFLYERQDSYEETPPVLAQSAYELDTAIMGYVKSGNYQALSATFQKKRGKAETPIAYHSVQEYKSGIISLLTLVTRAAIEGGMAPGKAYDYKNLCAFQIDAAPTVEDANSVFARALKNLCAEVAAIRYDVTDNPIVNRALVCINDYLREKLNAKALAAYMGISPTYLPGRFKKKTGLDLPTYIQKKKIEEAERLLVFTDNSISDISNYLSYSSQSYFQNVFHRLTGMTPKKYRLKKQSH